MNVKVISSDHLGVCANVACMLHCFATPFLFISQSEFSTLSHEIPFFWQSINYLLLIISFAAIFRSVQNSSNIYIKMFLITAWVFLSFFIINEGLEAYHIPEFFTYSAAITLSALHIYNLKYCACKDDECCIHNHKVN